jgi:hypothetical protein
MPFKPWIKHEEENGKCLHCGMELPVSGAVYSSQYVNGDPMFSPKPAGRSIPCPMAKPS